MCTTDAGLSIKAFCVSVCTPFNVKTAPRGKQRSKICISLDRGLGMFNFLASHIDPGCPKP